MSLIDKQQYFMQEALKEAQKAQSADEVPIGAVVAHNNHIIGRGFNQVITTHDPTAHAEIVALRQAAQAMQNYRLIDCQIYITLEPCMMCLGAMVHARLNHVYYATKEPKAGVVESQLALHKVHFLNHRLNVTGGILAKEASLLLSEFFKQKRQMRK